MTTATLRRQAAEAAARCDWPTAAALYRQAIAVYPGSGALADRDKARLAEKAEACESVR